MKKIVFTSGLPRSGSTLLSAILNQNPRFEAHSSVPIRQIFDSTIDVINGVGNDGTLFTDEKINSIFRSILENYHHTEGKEVYFNHNRHWTGRTHLLKRLYPNYKMIVLVRDIGWILDSFEVLSQKNIYHKPIYSSAAANSNIYTRCNENINLITPFYDSLCEMIHLNPSNCMILDYEALTKTPEIALKTIYEHIEEPYFNHDFNNVTFNNSSFDKDINMPDIHTVKGKVEYCERKTVIPPEIWNRVSGMEIWKNIKS